MSEYIHRALESVVKRCSAHFGAVVVTGPRQVGKTTMLQHLMDEDKAHGMSRSYVSLDDTGIRALAKEDPALFLQRYEPPIFIDEIQYAPELLPFIKIEIDKRRDSGLFWLTGSQPFHLMKGVSESLAGRAAIVEMLGLSSAEIYGYETRPFTPGETYFKNRVAQVEARSINQVYQDILVGGFPGIRTLPTDMRERAYASYVDTYLMRDIRDLSRVGDETRFRKFMAACAMLTSKPIVYSDLARAADIDEKTAKAWLSLLASSYLVKIIPSYFTNRLKRLSKRPIMHFTDTGLAAYLAGWKSVEQLEVGPYAGAIFETEVFSQIYRSYTNSGMDPQLFFFRTNDKKEIDLLLEREGTLYPIEVKKTARPQVADLKNFSALDPVYDPTGTDLLDSRSVGMGTVVCMTADTYPITNRAWAFPIWAL